MDKNFMELYDYLLSLDKLDKRDYEKLCNKYGNCLVDSVIEYIISEGNKNIHKFDDYVASVTLEDGFEDKSIMDMYIDDLGSYRMLSSAENKYYVSQVYEIILSLRKIFSSLDGNYIKHRKGLFSSIVDEAEYYMNSCNDINILNEIKDLYERFLFLRNKLIDGNIRVVVAAAKPYYKDEGSFSEIVQYGNIGLMKAIEKFDPNFETAFSTYAYYWVKSFFRGASKVELNSSYSLSYNLIEKNQVRLRIIDMLNFKLGRTPTTEEIANEMGISVKKLGELEYAFQFGLSLFSRVSLKDDNDCLFYEVCEDKSINIEEEIMKKEFLPFLIKCMDSCLNEREKNILINRFGLCDDALSLDDLIKKYGLCRQRIEHIKKRALVKLRNSCGKKLVEYLD